MTAKILKIGVSSCFFYPDPSRKVFGHKTLNYFERDMARYLAHDNVLPILIPDLEDDQLFFFLKQMDGFVFQGGDDLSPKSYGEEGILNNRWPGDFHRDQYELKILEYAYKNAKPVLGICRGCQLINVFFKGTLYQDLTTQYQDLKHTHRDAEKYDFIHHRVLVEEKSLLSRLYNQSKELEVNSVHHQGIKTLGKNLVIEAKSEDGIIEAVRFENNQHDIKNKAWIYGVQWHPEFSKTIENVVCSPWPLLEEFYNVCRK